MGFKEFTSCVLDNMLLFYIFGAFLHCEWKGTCFGHSHIIKTSLYDDLFRNYSARFIPVCNQGGKVDVYLGSALRQIMDLNEKEQILSINIWLRLKWHDCRLTWNSSDPQYGEIDHFVIPYADVWTPDITLYDSSAEEEMMPGRTDYRATVYSDGKMTYNFPTVLQSVCRVDVTYFPLDLQICSLKFGSWSHSGVELDLFASDVNADLSTYVTHNEWDIIKMPAVRSVLYYQCCVEPYPDVTYYIYMKRKPTFYIMTVLFPCILTSAIAALGFVLPPESGEKVSLEVTVLLSLAVFLLIVSEQLPASSDTFPYIGMYFASSMILVSLSCLMTIIVLNVHYRGTTGTNLPAWVRKIFLQKLGRLLCSNQLQKYTIEQNKLPSNKVTPDDIERKKEDIQANNHTIDNGDINYSTGTPSYVSSVSSKDLLMRTRDPMVNLLKDQSNTLSRLEGHMKKETDSDIRNNEWNMLAKVLDRLFFILYIFVTIVSAMGFLIRMGSGP